MQSTRLGISVVVCCYNSESRIEPTLRHLAAQVTDDDLPWEVVLVDNASTDNTANLAEQLWDDLDSSIPLRIVDEEQPGLSAARRRGTLEAKYAILIFCDDDNWLAADYVKIAADFMQSRPDVGICGGIGTAVSDVPFPDWFEHAKWSYAVGEQAANEGTSTSYL